MEISLTVASDIFDCWIFNSSNPLAKFSVVVLLIVLEVSPEKVEYGGRGGFSGQFLHLLCSS